MIEKGVEIPDKRSYPLKAMEVGDSFFIETDDRTRAARNIRSSIQFFRKGHPDTAFVVRVVDGGVRCWRTE